jgi:hypothetical protein
MNTTTRHACGCVTRTSTKEADGWDMFFSHVDFCAEHAPEPAPAAPKEGVDWDAPWVHALLAS